MVDPFENMMAQSERDEGDKDKMFHQMYMRKSTGGR